MPMAAEAVEGAHAPAATEMPAVLAEVVEKTDQPAS
jgi:hypothetical protein